MLIYLDNCCFNRPFDDQKQIRIYTKTCAKLVIQHGIISGKYDLAWSYMLDYENEANPYLERQFVVAKWKLKAMVDTGETEALLNLARLLIKKKLKAKDALHVACSVILRCDYFITTDIPLVKKLANFEGIKVVNPVNFLNLAN